VKSVAQTKVGDITHYYDHIGVAVVHVLAPIKVGDKIKIVSGDQEFEQEVASMQIEHKNVKAAKKGDDVGMKIDQPVKKGEIHRVE
jgi:translation elongation factor EF-1alpha